MALRQRMTRFHRSLAGQRTDWTAKVRDAPQPVVEAGMSRWCSAIQNGAAVSNGQNRGLFGFPAIFAANGSQQETSRSDGVWMAINREPPLCHCPCRAARMTPPCPCSSIVRAGRCPAHPAAKASGWSAGSWRNAPVATQPCRSMAPIAAGRTGAHSSVGQSGCRSPDQAFRAFSAAIQASIWLSSTVSGTAPCANTASWKRRRSNFGPRAFSALARSSRILISPSL